MIRIYTIDARYDNVCLLDKIKTYYRISEAKLSSNAAIILFDTLRNKEQNLTVLNLERNNLDDECMKSLGELLTDNQTIKKIEIGANKLTDKGIEILSEYLIGNTSLETLRICRNQGITDESMPFLKELINRSCLTNIELFGTCISHQYQSEIENLLKIPTDQREIPIKSNSKSAAKISFE